MLNILIVGGDVTGKAMVPVVNEGNGKYNSTLFGKETISTTADELEKVKKDISNVGFYPIVIDQDRSNRIGKQSGQNGCPV